MKLLGIDFGIKRVGLAVTDAAATLAFPKKTLYRTTRETLFAALLTIIEEEKPELIVIGLPDVQETGDNEPALIVRQIRNFAAVRILETFIAAGAVHRP